MASLHPRHVSRASKPHRGLYVVALTLVALLSFAATAVAVGYYQLGNNIVKDDVKELIPQAAVPEIVTPDDPNAGQPLNILVMGTDSRDGENADLGGEVEGMRSDTTILVHISADRQRVEMISIPRDSWVQIPACLRADGSSSSAKTTKFNAAFAYGGQNGDVGSAAACTISTIQSLTGVYINGYVVVDFAGFASVVDALGGVDINVPQHIESPKAGNLVLEAGLQTLDGATAIQYARARSGVGLSGSDLDRITRQQQLFTAVIAKAKASVTDVPTLYKFLNATTQTLTTSPNLGNLSTMAGLAWSLHDIKDENIVFVTVPTTFRSDGANVEWTDEADVLWSKVIADQPLVEVPVATSVS